jgi:hypothetical protein
MPSVAQETMASKRRKKENRSWQTGQFGEFLANVSALLG